MIRSIEEIGNSLQYRNTPETYQELIDRQTQIILNWHETHASMLYKLKQHIKAFPEDYSSVSTLEDRAHMYSLTEDWLRDLKIILDIEE